MVFAATVIVLWIRQPFNLSPHFALQVASSAPTSYVGARCPHFWWWYSLDHFTVFSPAWKHWGFTSILTQRLMFRNSNFTFFSVNPPVLCSHLSAPQPCARSFWQLHFRNHIRTIINASKKSQPKNLRKKYDDKYRGKPTQWPKGGGLSLEEWARWEGSKGLVSLSPTSSDALGWGDVGMRGCWGKQTTPERCH